MDNSTLYFKWFSEKKLAPILLPNMVAVDGPDGTIQFVVQGAKSDDQQGKRKVRGILPFVRTYWTNPFIRTHQKEKKEELEEGSKEHKSAERDKQRLRKARRKRSRPPWEPKTWFPLLSRDRAWLRFLRADQALDLLAWMHPPDKDPKAFKRQIQKALEAWFVAIDDTLIEQPSILSTRVDTVQFSVRPDRKYGYLLDWSRSLGGFPNDLRRSLAGDCTANGKNPGEWEDLVGGLDPVHTPENTRAGLVRYLCRGWTIGNDGKLVRPEHRAQWGVSSAAIPFRMNNAPRRLMLGSSLQTRAVGLLRYEEPDHDENPPQWLPQGRKLFAVFSTFGGWTHEDAFVLSESACVKLTSMRTQRIDLFVPRIANRVEVAELGNYPCGTLLAHAYVDLYAMGYRPYEAETLAANNDWHVENGWLEIELPGAKLSQEAELLNADRRPTPTSWRWRELITFHLESCAPVQIGDKLATPHGIKGVVSRILPDDEMPMVDGRRAEIVLSPLGIIRRGAMGQFREAAGGMAAQALPRAGTIFVIRQPQDSSHPDRYRMLGPERQHDGVRGQRYGEMEFWALMAHGAHAVANELLSFKRSTARWMRMESETRLRLELELESPA